MNILVQNKLSGNAATPSLFQSAAEESAILAPHRKTISSAYRVVMAVLQQANAPDNVRNFIDALINLSSGEVRVEATDFQVARAFYKDENKRGILKKKVQRWRKALHKWQTESGYTLVQIRPGFKICENKNQPSIYQLVVLEIAAKVLAQGETDIEAAARAVLGEARGIPSKIDEARRRPQITADSCRVRGVTWVKKSLEMAYQEGCLNETINDIDECVRYLLEEYKNMGGTDSSHHNSDQGGTDVDTISTIYNTSSNINHISKKEDVPKVNHFYSQDIPESINARASESKQESGKIEPESMLAIALDHARRGFQVFPVHVQRANGCSCWMNDKCPTPAKHPRIKGWTQVATTDEKTIRQWWQKFPNANIGIATGTASSVVVLDVDVKNDGDQTLAALEKEFGALPETLTARTGGGGRHILFKCPDGTEIRNVQASKILRGLDIRGEGGFIVASGSVHASGKRYEWIDEKAPIADMPDWLVKRLTTPASSQSGATRETSRTQRTDVVQSGGLNSVIHEGGRNNFLFTKAAGLVRSHDLAKSLDRVQWWNEQCCIPPVSEYELEKIVRHAHARYSGN